MSERWPPPDEVCRRLRSELLRIADLDRPAAEFQMPSPEYVIQLHDSIIHETGGAAGLRDRGSLESALAAPRNLQAYEDAALAPRVAAALWHLAKAHAFTDGNKRTAFATVSFAVTAMGLGRHLESKDPAGLMLAAATMSRTCFTKIFLEDCRLLGDWQSLEKQDGEEIE